MIYTEETPNPNAIKFVSKETFSEVGVQEFQKRILIKLTIILLKIY